jgi:hypothetical protein
MADIEFRLRRSADEFEPFYVRIAESGDGNALAFTENAETDKAGAAAIAALRAGEVTPSTFYDRDNDVWFFRFKGADGEVLFRSMSCPTEAAMEATIERILTQAPDAEVVDERRASA